MKQLNEVLPKLAARYFKKKIPIIPVERKEARLPGWNDLCLKFPGKDKIAEITEMVSALNITGIGIPLGPCSGLVAVDVDSTNEEELRIIYDLLPESPVVKIGKKGETRFYKYDGEEGKKKITTVHGTAIEFFGSRAYTVIPPSIHPDTKKSYLWKNNESTILNSDLSTLPTFSKEIWEKIEKKLKPEKAGRVNSLVKNSAGGGRNDQLKSMACAMIAENKKSLKKIAEDLVSYDKRNHASPLFSDKSESIYSSEEPITNAIRFVVNIDESVRSKGLPLVTQSSQKINVLSLGEFLEEDRFPEQKPIVEKIMNLEELHLFSAAAKSGKTMLQINLAIAVASGTPFLDYFKTHKGRVLIIQTEVSERFSKKSKENCWN